MSLRFPLPLALLLACPLALAQEDAPAEEASTRFTLLAHGDKLFYWTLEGSPERNPTLVVPPGEQITIVVRNVDDMVHNLVVESFGESAYVNSVGDETTFTFTAPESGVFEYYCEPHKAGGMEGIVRVAGTPEPARETPAPGGAGLLGAIAVTALLVGARPRRRVR